MDFKAACFDPGPFDPATDTVVRHEKTASGETRSLYVYDRALVLAINVALAARRPLLLAGEPGSGKTTLARNIALVLGSSYYEATITSRTHSGDLLWQFDALARLNDANARDGRDLLEDGFYVDPGPLWWALAPESAARRGLPPATQGLAGRTLTDPGVPAGRPAAVLLIDELDKAEPEVPNDLLEVVDALSFRIKQQLVEATRNDVLMLFSTNGERDFPGAFQRRCVVYRFPDQRPAAWYQQIARRWLPDVADSVAAAVAARLIECRDDARAAGQRMPGTAEYLDALRAMRTLGVAYDGQQAADAQSPAWQALEALVFRKSTTPGDA